MKVRTVEVEDRLVVVVVVAVAVAEVEVVEATVGVVMVFIKVAVINKETTDLVVAIMRFGVIDGMVVETQGVSRQPSSLDGNQVGCIVAFLDAPPYPIGPVKV